MMNRRACASYQRSGSLPAMEFKTNPLYARAATLGHSTGPQLPSRPQPLHSPASLHSVGSNASINTRKRVHFEASSARRALSTLKSFTNKSVQSIKEHYRAHHPKNSLPHHQYPANWISDAAQQSGFASPRSLKPPSPLRSCLRRAPSRATSLRSVALRDELCYFEDDTMDDIDSPQSRDTCLIDDLVDQRLINSMWVPLNPTQYTPLCIDDIKDLF